MEQEERMQALRDQRSELVTDLAFAYDKADAAKEAVQDNEAPWGRITAAEAEAEAVEAAIAEFDAAHPEVVAELVAKEARKTEEALRRAFND